MAGEETQVLTLGWVQIGTVHTPSGLRTGRGPTLGPFRLSDGATTWRQGHFFSPSASRCFKDIG